MPFHPASVFDLTNAVVSERERIPAAGLTSGLKTETKRVEAVRAEHYVMLMVSASHVQLWHVDGMFRCPHTFNRCPQMKTSHYVIGLVHNAPVPHSLAQYSTQWIK